MRHGHIGHLGDGGGGCLGLVSNDSILGHLGNDTGAGHLGH